MNDPMAKHFTFDLKFGLAGPGTSLDAATTRRLAILMEKLDSDAPRAPDVFPDGIVDFWWRKPPQEEKIVEAIKTLKIDFRYRFVGQGRDHKDKDCQNCDESGPYRYGGICFPIVTEDDWKTVRIA